MTYAHVTKLFGDTREGCGQCKWEECYAIVRTVASGPKSERCKLDLDSVALEVSSHLKLRPIDFDHLGGE